MQFADIQFHLDVGQMNQKMANLLVESYYNMEVLNLLTISYMKKGSAFPLQ